MRSNRVHDVKLYLALMAAVVAFLAGTLVWTTTAPVVGLALLVIGSICLYLALTIGARRG